MSKNDWVYEQLDAEPGLKSRKFGLKFEPEAPEGNEWNGGDISLVIVDSRGNPGRNT
jgi:hypothetical protein